MGIYTTAAKVFALYPKLKDMSLSDQQVGFYIDLAEAEINGRIATRYTLPFSTSPAMLESVATEYTLIKLMDRFFTAEAPTKGDWKEVRRRELKELLGGISDGTISLVNSSYGVITQDTALTISSDTETYTPTFNHLDPSMQKIDEDRLDSEEDDID